MSARRHPTLPARKALVGIVAALVLSGVLPGIVSASAEPSGPPAAAAAGVAAPPADFDGNGLSDPTVFRDGKWITAGKATVTFGAKGDVPVPGQWDADAATDRAVFRPSSGRWFVEGDGVPAGVAFGARGDLPVPGDYDGDGRVEQAVFRPSNGRWFLTGSGLPSSVPWGIQGDIPVPGYYDADPGLDLAVYRPSSSRWYFEGGGSVQWGAPNDVPVPGQWDADPATDLATFRPATGRWYVQGGATSNFGLRLDVPVPGQYDADAAFDVGAFRPQTATLFAQAGSSVAASKVGAFGDQPAGLPYAIWQHLGARWVMGYYVGYQTALMPANEIDWRNLTHLAIGRVEANPDGSLKTDFDRDPAEGPTWARSMAALAKANGVRPILMVGGQGSRAGFFPAVTAHLSTLVDNLAQVMTSYGFDGLDIDWEEIAPGDDQPLLDLLTALRARLPQALLTLPVYASNLNANGQSWDVVRPFVGQAAKLVDRVSIMSYGMAGPYEGWQSWFSSPLRGHTAGTPMSVEESVGRYLGAGVPPGKLNVGVGLYGICYQGGGITQPRQSLPQPYESHFSADDNALTYTKIMASYHTPAAYHYDATAQAPWLGFASPKGPMGCTYLSYEDATSISAKGGYALRNGLGGAIIWTIAEGHALGAPSGQRDPLVRATRASLNT